MKLKCHEYIKMQIVWWNAYMNYNAPTMFDEKLILTKCAKVWKGNVIILNAI